MKKLFTLFIIFSSIATFGQFSATDSVVVGSTNSYSNDCRGFSFVPQQDIYVQKLGKIIPNDLGEYTWVLWDVASQTKVYEQVSLSNDSAAYSYENTDSIIKLNSGVEYALSMYCDTTSGALYYYGASTQINSHLTYVTMRYCNNCGPTTYPDQTYGGNHYGIPDLIFECYTTPTIINDTACNSYTSPSGNYTWYTSGTYTDTIQRTSECDSIIVINLTINSSSSNITDTACESYTSPSGNYTWVTSGTYTDTLVNYLGCDSVITIDLTINNIDNTIDTVRVCNSYTWIDGNTYTDNNNTATYTYTNIHGCDSIITLNLTIDTINMSVTQNGDSLISNESVSGASYQWLDCNNSYAEITNDTNQLFVAQSNGSYAVLISYNSCVDTSACYTTTNISKNSISDVVVYPNPTNGNFTINLDNNFSEVYIKITNISGQTIKNQQFNNTNKIDIDFNNNASGIYFIEITAGDKKSNIKLIKE